MTIFAVHQVGQSYFCGVAKGRDLLPSGIAPFHSSVPNGSFRGETGCAKPGDYSVLH